MILGAKKHIKQVFADFPNSELWRFFIDGFRHDEGKFAFDKGLNAESGYYASMKYAWKKMLKEIDVPVTLAYIQQMQWAATTKLSKVQANVLRKEGDSAHGFSLLSIDNPWGGMAWNCTPAGIKEFIYFVRENESELRKRNQNYFFILTANRDFKSIGIDEMCHVDVHIDELVLEINAAAKLGNAKLMLKGDAKESAEEIIAQYHNELQLTQSPDAVLSAISKCVCRMERLHIFRDSNCRTMVLTLNKMLLQNKLLPTILENPNRMDMLSTEEFMEQIKNGQKRFLECCVQSPLFSLLENEPESSQSILSNYFFDKDFILSLVQLNAVYKRIAEQKIRIHNNTKKIKTDLQKMYLERFRHLIACLRYYKKNVIKYQLKYEKLHELWTVDLSDQAQGDFEKSAFLAQRTPTKIAWIEESILKFSVKHSKMINHIPQNEVKSELAESFAQFCMSSESLMRHQQTSQEKQVKKNRVYRKSWSGYPSQSSTVEVEKENHDQIINTKDKVFIPAKKTNTRARSRSQIVTPIHDAENVESIIKPMKELKLRERKSRQSAEYNKPSFLAEEELSIRTLNTTGLLSIHEDEALDVKQLQLGRRGSQKK